MASRSESQIAKDYGPNGASKQPWRTRDIWVFRILVGGTILALGTGGLIAFLVIGLPVIFIGGGLLIFFSPVLIFIATITSPIWVPIGGLILATPPILGALSVGAVTFLFFAYWAYNYFRSSKTSNPVTDAYAAVKDQAGKLQDGVYEATSAARQRGAGRSSATDGTVA